MLIVSFRKCLKKWPWLARFENQWPAEALARNTLTILRQNAEGPAPRKHAQRTSRVKDGGIKKTRSSAGSRRQKAKAAIARNAVCVVTLYCNIVLCATAHDLSALCEFGC